MTTNTKRVIYFAFTDFYRNKGISIAAIFVLTVTTLLITGIFFVHGMSNYLIDQIQNKIDIAAYFKADTQEEDILNVKNELLQEAEDVKKIQYISREDALENFIAKHGDSDVFSRALSEVGDNPFLPSLNITTGTTAQYEEISQILNQEKFNNLIEKVDFSEKKGTIEKVFSVTSSINRFGLGVAIILILFAMLVVFNTMKLVIDSSKDEINTMRIVGASNWLVRVPFIIEGGIFGGISFFLSFLVTILLVYLLHSGLAIMIPGFSLFGYFMNNLWLVILIQIGFGVGLGVISSYIVVRKYLKV